jgi:hypothetical protein
VRWSFLRAGFRLNPKDLLAALTVTRTEARERIVVPELSLEEFVFLAPDEAVKAAERPACRRVPIPGPTEFAISLKADVDKVAATCPLCGHRDIQRDRKEGENTENIKLLSCRATFSDHPHQIFRGSFSIQLLFL